MPVVCHVGLSTRFINTLTYLLWQRSPEGINLNSHGWSDGTPVPERNPWLARERMPTPKGVEFPSLSMFNPFRVGSSIGHSHGFRLALHPVAIQVDPDRIYETYDLARQRFGNMEKGIWRSQRQQKGSPKRQRGRSERVSVRSDRAPTKGEPEAPARDTATFPRWRFGLADSGKCTNSRGRVPAGRPHLGWIL